MANHITLKNRLTTVEAVAGRKAFPVNGFSFTLDDPEAFDPYTAEAAAAAGFPVDPAAPVPEGFMYVTDAYQAYLNGLKETGAQHPANTQGLPWCPTT